MMDWTKFHIGGNKAQTYCRQKGHELCEKILCGYKLLRCSLKCKTLFNACLLGNNFFVLNFDLVVFRL
jgi:hypothetical protein